MVILGKGYDTPFDLAQKIIDILPDQDVESVIDISCGSGNLLKAAKKRWPHAHCVGIDIDRCFASTIDDGIELHLGDGRSFATDEYINDHSYDLVLANPPYGKKKDDFSFPTSIPKEYSKIKSFRMEIDMLLGNALLVKEDGILVTIMPATLLYGRLYEKIKIALSARFSICSIIELPNNTFKKSEVSSCVIIWKKKLNMAPIQYFIAQKQIDKWIFHAKEDKGDLIDARVFNIDGILVFRGSISSNDFADTGMPVLHNSVPQLNQTWFPNAYFTHKESESNKHAEFGDIVINRIGKGAGYWTEYNRREKCLVSDCLIILRINDDNVRKYMLDYLNSNSINGRLLNLTKGVAAKYVTQSDILNIVSSFISSTY